MHDDTPALPPPAGPAPHRAGRWRTWWALPFLLSLLFVASVAGWLQWSDQQEMEDRRRTLISDALSLEGRISGRIAEEQLRLDGLARQLESDVRPGDFPHLREVDAGLRRFWLSVTWLDDHNRQLAQWPDDRPATLPAPVLRPGELDENGQTAHLASAIGGRDGRPEAGHLVARYSPAALLRQTVPWWLARRYDVRLVDSFGQALAAAADEPVSRAKPGPAASHRISLEPALNDTFLELRLRERFVPWFATLAPWLMGGFVLLVGAATGLLRAQVASVTRAEAAWRTEAAWRRAMEDSLTVGLRARNLEGQLVYVNRGFCDLVGFAPEELLRRAPPMPYWPPDALDESMWRLQRNLAGAAPREGYEARWVHRDGRAIEVYIVEAPLVDASGRHIGWMGSILDITARKRLEERERRQHETLAHQARLSMLGEVASALAHELNQPLTAITGYNAGVRRSLERAGFTDQAVLDALHRLGEQATQAGRVVQRIREFLTRRAPQRERCELPEVARHAAGLLRRDLQRLEVQLQWALAEGLPPVHADPVLIEQVVINLVRNALDELGDCRGPRAIRIGAVLAGERFVRLDVEDNGPGLGGRDIEQLCTPFYSTKSDGMGMGLAICRSIVEAHYGAFDTGASALGGARLSFTLPTCGTEMADEAAAGESAA